MKAARSAGIGIVAGGLGGVAVALLFSWSVAVCAGLGVALGIIAGAGAEINSRRRH